MYLSISEIRGNDDDDDDDDGGGGGGDDDDDFLEWLFVSL